MKNRGPRQSKLDLILALFKIGWLFGCLITVFQLILDTSIGFLIQSSLAPMSTFSIAKSIGLAIGHFLVLLLFTKDLIYGYDLKSKSQTILMLISIVALASYHFFVLTKHMPSFPKESISIVLEQIYWTNILAVIMLIGAYLGIIYNRIKVLNKRH